MGVGVQQRCLIAHDADVPAPKHEVAAPQAGKVRVDGDWQSQRVFLQIGVARRSHPGRVERNLHEAGAIDAEARLAAPEIGRMQKPLGHGDEVCLALAARQQMIREDESGIADFGEPDFVARTRTEAPSGKASREAVKVRPRINEGPVDCYAVVG